MRLSPLRVFRFFAFTEACTWVGLLAGMFLTYVTETTELGVKVFGPIHGVAFIGYCLVTVVVAVDQRWRPGRTMLALVAAIPPLATIPFERYVEKRGGLGECWLSRHDSETAAQRAVCWLLRHHRSALAIFGVTVAALTGIALVAGPPA